jgi:hypothetical protein
MEESIDSKIENPISDVVIDHVAHEITNNSLISNTVLYLIISSVLIFLIYKFCKLNFKYLLSFQIKKKNC